MSAIDETTQTSISIIQNLLLPGKVSYFVRVFDFYQKKKNPVIPKASHNNNVEVPGASNNSTSI